MRLGLMAQQLQENFWKKVVPPVPVDCTYPSLPDEDGFFNHSLLLILFLSRESHTLPVDHEVHAGNVVHQCRLVDLCKRLLPPSPGIRYPF